MPKHDEDRKSEVYQGSDHTFKKKDWGTDYTHRLRRFARDRPDRCDSWSLPQLRTQTVLPIHTIQPFTLTICKGVSSQRGIPHAGRNSRNEFHQGSPVCLIKAAVPEHGFKPATSHSRMGEDGKANIISQYQ